jgi:hypothetical protein
MHNLHELMNLGDSNQSASEIEKVLVSLAGLEIILQRLHVSIAARMKDMNLMEI